MGMSSKPKSVSTSTSGSAQTWAQPYATAGATSVQNVFNQNQSGLQDLTNLTRNNVVNPLLGKFNSSLGTAGQANGFYGDILSGKYMSGNPYLGNILGQTRRDITNDVNSQFELNGRYGSDAHGYGLSRGLSDAENNLLYQNYGDEMNRMGQAAQAAQAGNQADIASLLSSIGAGAELPYTGSNNLANSLGALFNGGTSKSTQTGPSPIWGAIGAGLGAAGAAFSDIRLKTKVEKVGEFADGLGIYRFAYKSDPKQMFKGVMAHEVKQLRPWAYIENYRGSGYDGVNYGAL